MRRDWFGTRVKKEEEDEPKGTHFLFSLSFSFLGDSFDNEDEDNSYNKKLNIKARWGIL